jgi:hypothetical protein
MKNFLFQLALEGLAQRHRLPRRIGMKPLSFSAVVILLFIAVVDFPGCDVYQVRYAKNLHNSDSIIQITNNGASSNTIPSGARCVNVYGLAKGKLIACCSCLVVPDQLVRLSVQKDLLANNNFPPDSMVIKLIPTANTGGATVSSNCDASKVGTDGAHTIAPGLAAWSTVSQPLSPFFQTSNATETPFWISPLNPLEEISLTGRCTPALGASSICSSCQ